MIEGFDHVGTDHKCNVCQCDFTDDEGGIQGYLGILPVAFCPTCFAGLCDMVEQMNDRDWEGLTDKEWHDIWEEFASQHEDERSRRHDEFQKEMVAKHGGGHYYMDEDEDWNIQKDMIQKLVENKLQEKNG